MHHPCQSLADMLTIREKLGAGRKRVVLTWAWHPKALPMAVPNSFALAAAQMKNENSIKMWGKVFFMLSILAFTIQTAI